MSKQERFFQICLYMGALLLVLIADWHWYAGRYPQGNSVLKAELYPLIYGAFLAATGTCFVGAIYFGRKAGPRVMGHRNKKK